MAKEFADFTDSDKDFRKMATAAGVDPSVPGTEGQRRYLPFEIRKIRQYLAKVYPQIKPYLYSPPLMVFRITKGGTGKTTLCANAAVGLAMQGYKVLVIDGDSQGSISMTLGYDINAGISFNADADKAQLAAQAKSNLVHIGHVLQRLSRNEPTGIQDAVVPLYANGMLDLLPADVTIANEAWMFNVPSREKIFQRLLAKEREFFSQYDAVLIDCAPGTSMMSYAIMSAAQIVTAVVTPEPQALVALLGIESNLEEINTLVREGQPPVNLHIIVNDYRGALEPHKECSKYLANNYREFLNPGIVRSFIGFKREIDLYYRDKSAPLLEKEPSSPGAVDVMYVLKHLINLYGVKIYSDPVEAGAEIAEEVA